MSVFIDSIDVTGLIKADLFPTGILAATEVSSAGSIIVYERDKNYFMVDLIGTDNSGWLMLSVLQSLQNLAKIIGATYTLDYEGEISTVRFRTDEPPVVYGDKIINRSNQNTTDYYNNILIKLMET